MFVCFIINIHHFLFTQETICSFSFCCCCWTSVSISLYKWFNFFNFKLFFCLFNLKKIDDKLIINEKCLGFQSLLCLVVFFWNVCGMFFFYYVGDLMDEMLVYTKKITNLTYCNDAYNLIKLDSHTLIDTFLATRLHWLIFVVATRLLWSLTIAK